MKVKTKHIYIFFFGLLMYLGAFSFNDHNTDSLTNVLKTLRPEGIPKIDLLIAIAENIMNENHERSLMMVGEALDLSEKIEYKKGIYKSNYILGRIYTNYSLNFTKAMLCFTAAEKVLDKEDWQQQLNLLTQIAYLHKRQENSEKAIVYYERAIQMAENNGSAKLVSNLNGYLSEVYESSGDTVQALQCLQKIVDIERNTLYSNTEPAALLSIAHYYELQHQYGPAESFLLDALTVFKKTKNYRWASYTDCLLAKLNMRKKEYKTAIEYANTGLELAVKFGLKKETADNHSILSALFDSIHDYKNAYLHHKALKEIDDSIFSTWRAKEMANAMTDYETLIKEKQLAKLEAEKKLDEAKLSRTKIIAIATFALMVLGVCLAIIFYRNYRIKRKINKELWNRIELRKLKLDEIIKQLNLEIENHQATKSKLEVVNVELNNFMYKSSHDLKSPLASILGLTHIAKGNIEDKERMEYLTMIERSTRRLSTFIDELSLATRVTHGEMKMTPVNVFDICNEIAEDLGNSEVFKGVRIIMRIGKDLEIHTDKNLLKTILHNLIENGAKYKNVAAENPFVSVSAERMGNALMLCVSDNGLGIALEHQSRIFEMFYRANTITQGSGLGLYLVEKSVSKLGGEIRLRSQQGEGTAVEISIPDVVRRPAMEKLMT